MIKWATIALLTGLAVQPQLLLAQESSRITEFRKAQINLFSADGKTRLKKVSRESLPTPLNVVDVLPSGFYVFELEGETHAVRKRVVRTNRVYDLTSTCSNQLAVQPAGTTRGLGNGEC